MNRIINTLAKDYKPLPIYFHSIDNYHNQENVYSPYGKRYFHQILVVVEGMGILNCRNKTFPLKKGCAFFVEASVPHEYIDTGGLVTAYATACGSAVHMMMEHFGCDGFLYYESVDLERYLADINDMIKEYHGKCRDSVMSAILYAFYMRFFQQDRESKLVSIDKTVLYIEQNHTKKLTLQKLAEVNGTSVSKLCHDFKQRFGCTVFEYLVSYRLSTARELLRIDRDVTTKEAALSVGFEDISYFCRAYKRKFGKTPSEDRKVD